MKYPDIKYKKAVYVESREARVVIVKDVFVKDGLVEITVGVDHDVAHMRTRPGDERYKKRSTE